VLRRPPPNCKKDAGGKITDHRPGGEKAKPNNCYWADEQTSCEYLTTRLSATKTPVRRSHVQLLRGKIEHFVLPGSGFACPIIARVGLAGLWNLGRPRYWIYGCPFALAWREKYSFVPR
jgi:hypothetical protein